MLTKKDVLGKNILTNRSANHSSIDYCLLFMKNLNMSENDAAARREARRKRILENSEHRLKKIVGATTVDSIDDILSEKLLGFSSNDVTYETRNSEAEPERNLQDNEANPLKFDYLLKDFQQQEKKCETKKSWIQIALQKRAHYVLLAILVQLLLNLNFGFLFYENIICPFYTMKVVEFLATRQQQQEIEPNIVLLLSGVSPETLKSIQRIYVFVTSFIADFFFYVFTFIISTKLHNIIQ